MRNYCRYLLTIFLMLPVLVCATSFIFVTQDKSVDIVPDDNSYGGKIHLEPYRSTVVPISNGTSFRIGTTGNYVKVTGSGASYSTETNGDIGVYKANVLMSQTKFSISKDVNLVIAIPKVTRTVTKESEIKDASNIFVIADRQGKGKRNMYQQLQAGMMASGVYCEFSKTASNDPNYISNLITEIDNFYNAADRTNYLPGKTQLGSKKITLVVDFDQNSTNPQNHIEQIKTWIAALINGLKNKGQIKKVVFLSHTKEDDDAVIKAVGESVTSQKNSKLTTFPISHIQGGNIDELLGVSFAYNRVGQEETSSEPTMEELEKRKTLAETQAAEEKVKTYRIKQEKLLQTGAESNQVLPAEESKESLKEKLAQKQASFQKVNGEINRLESKEVNNGLDEEESGKLEKLEKGKLKLKKDIKDINSKLMQYQETDAENVDSDNEFMDLISE